MDLCLQEIARGDNNSFTKLYQDTRKGIFSFVYGYCQNYHMAEDITQTVYIKVKSNITKYTAGTDARAWIFQIAKNTTLNELKKSKREMSTDFATDKTFGESGYEMSDTPVFEAIQKALGQEERHIVILHIIWGFKHREIAQMLDLSLGSVLWKYNNAIKKLQKYLTKEDA